jgi:hypothetical protein
MDGYQFDANFVVRMDSVLGRVFSQALYKSLKFKLFLLRKKYFINNNSIIKAYIKKRIIKNYIYNIY